MLKDWNFWERDFVECVLTTYRLPVKNTQSSDKLPYRIFDAITDRWPREYRSKFWTFCYRLNKSEQGVFVMNIIKLLA